MKLDFLKVVNDGGGKPVRLDLFGAIGGDFWDRGIDESVIKAQLEGIDENAAIDIYINSPGGSVFTALAIYNLFLRHQGDITITVAGLAASAATIITSLPDAKVIMPRGALMLVHPVRQYNDGPMTPEEMQEVAENLEKIRESILDIYAEKTCKPRDELLALMSKESFLTAAEAVEWGFADAQDDAQTVENRRAGDAVMCNGLRVSASLFDKAPAGYVQAEKTAGDKGEKMDLEKLKAEHPDILEAIRAEAIEEGAAQERARIKAIEEIAVAGYENIVAAAKFDNVMTADAVAAAIIKAQKAQAEKMLQDHAADAAALADVGADANLGMSPDAEAAAKEAAEKAAVIAAGKKAFSGR